MIDAKAPLGEPIDMADETRGRHVHRDRPPAILEELDEHTAVMSFNIRRADYLQVLWVPGSHCQDQAFIVPFLIEAEWTH